MRQVVVDTETTGIEISEGHRLIEIGCIELIDRRITGRRFHSYLNPNREIEAEAFKVHGLSQAFLSDKPFFSDIADKLTAFLKGAELIIHNAPFDVGFLNYEFGLLGEEYASIDTFCSILDTLVLAKKKHPGQRNNLDALCKRYSIDNSKRELHGALLDAEILTEVYLVMTGGQTGLFLDQTSSSVSSTASDLSGHHYTEPVTLFERKIPLKIIRPTQEEQDAHLKRCKEINAISGGHCLWNERDKTL